jgi:predicted RNA binding protein YcfA (HicA-like mRNA interferase family)
MSNLPVISSRECIRALEKAGFYVERQKGSHIIMVRDEPPPSLTIVVPNHKELKKGTLRTIIRQSGLTVDEFKNLLKK